ncbi:MAG: hypothetical protein IPI42_14680 [Saprospiraceae bacterium]|nr:hypothetical protein [Candidatus Parvibacillus calidus]
MSIIQKEDLLKVFAAEQKNKLELNINQAELTLALIDSTGSQAWTISRKK